MSDQLTPVVGMRVRLSAEFLAEAHSEKYAACGEGTIADREPFYFDGRHVCDNAFVHWSDDTEFWIHPSHLVLVSAPAPGVAAATLSDPSTWPASHRWTFGRWRSLAAMSGSLRNAFHADSDPLTRQIIGVRCQRIDQAISYLNLRLNRKQ